MPGDLDLMARDTPDIGGAADTTGSWLGGVGGVSDDGIRIMHYVGFDNLKYHEDM